MGSKKKKEKKCNCTFFHKTSVESGAKTLITALVDLSEKKFGKVSIFKGLSKISENKIHKSLKKVKNLLKQNIDNDSAEHCLEFQLWHFYE